MVVKLICLETCSNCRKVKKWLEARGVQYEERSIRSENPTAQEIAEWREKSGYPLKRFFNTSGEKYRELKLKEKLPAMTEEEQLALLAADGMLVRRPILLTEDRVLVGFREAEWAEIL